MTEGGPRLDFRDMTEADLADGLRLSRASGWNQTLADWRLLLSLGPGLFRVAVEDGRVVASGGAVRYGDALAWICMILVEPDGAATASARASSTRCSSAARPRCGRGACACVGLDATPAGRGIYAQRGFVDGGGSCGCARRGQVVARPRARERVEADAALPDPADLDRVLAFDREVFGADRGAAAARGPRRRARARVGRKRAGARGRLLLRPPRATTPDHVGPGRRGGPRGRSRSRAGVPLAAAPPPAHPRRPRRAGLARRARQLGFRGAAALHAHVPRRRETAGAARDRARGVRPGVRVRAAGVRADAGPIQNGRVMTEAVEPSTPTLALVAALALAGGVAAGPQAATQKPSLPGRDGDRHGGRDRDRAGRRAGARPAARGLHGERGRRRAGGRELRGRPPARRRSREPGGSRPEPALRASTNRGTPGREPATLRDRVRRAAPRPRGGRARRRAVAEFLETGVGRRRPRARSWAPRRARA